MCNHVAPFRKPNQVDNQIRSKFNGLPMKHKDTLPHATNVTFHGEFSLMCLQVKLPTVRKQRVSHFLNFKKEYF